MEGAICSWSAGEIVARVAARYVSVTEVVSAFLKRIDAINPHLDAICTPTHDFALASAREADCRLAAGYGVRALEGVPFNVKDNIPVDGIRCTYGSELFKDLVPDESAISVERLLASGAVLVGKSNTPEFADDPYCNTTNALFGQTRNPWDVNRTPGGTTGGGSAATSAKLAPIAIGTDWGGSIRGPAGFCGIVGMRQSSGLVPVYPDDTRTGFGWDFAIEHGHSPMARSVADVARALSVMVGPDPRALSALPTDIVGDLSPEADELVDLRGARVAFTTDYGGVAPCDPEVAQAVRAAAELFERLGCEVEEATPDFSSLKEIIAGNRALGVALRYSNFTGEMRERLSPRLNAQIESALAVDIATVAHSERLRTSVTRGFGAFMESFDLLVSPTWSVIPFRIDVPFDYTIAGERVENFFDCVLFTYSMSVLGAPSISVPGAVSREGLPIGVQIASRAFADREVLRAAAAYEAARGPFSEPPDVHGQVANPADSMFLSSIGSVPWRTTDADSVMTSLPPSHTLHAAGPTDERC